MRRSVLATVVATAAVLLVLMSTRASAQDGSVIRIGVSELLVNSTPASVLATLSTTTVTFAEEIVRAYTLWANLVNSNGGIYVNGSNYTVALVLLNSQGSYEKNEANLALMNSGAYGRVDFYFSGTANQRNISIYATQNQLITINPFLPTLTCAPDANGQQQPSQFCTVAGGRFAPFTWALSFSYDSYGSAPLLPLRNSGAKSILFFYYTSQYFGPQIIEYAKKTAADERLKVVGTLAFNGSSHTQEDFNVIMYYVRKYDPDVIYGLGNDICRNFSAFAKAANYLPRAVIMNQCFTVGTTGPDLRYFVGRVGWDARYQGSDYMQGTDQFYVLPVVENSTAPLQFNASYYAASGASPRTISAIAFTVGYVLHSALLRANSFTRLLVKRALDTTIITTPLGTVAFDGNGANARTEYGAVQMDSNQTLQLLLPLSSSTANLIYPMPQWSEREFEISYLSSLAEQILVAIACFCILCTLAFMLVVFMVRHKTYMHHATPLFCELILVGALLVYGSTMVWTYYTTDGMCIATIWLFNVGITIALAAMLTKTWRVYRIFRNKRLQTTVIKQATILKYLSVQLAFQLALLVIWTAVDPPRVTVVVSDPYRPSKNVLYCQSNLGQMWIAFEIAFHGLFLLAGMLLAYMTRKVPTSFNESKHIALSFYNISLCSVVALGILLSRTLSTYEEYIVRSVVILFVTSLTVIILFAPKFYQDIRPGQFVNPRRRSKGQEASMHELMKMSTTELHEEIIKQQMLLEDKQLYLKKVMKMIGSSSVRSNTGSADSNPTTPTTQMTPHDMHIEVYDDTSSTLTSPASP